MKTKLYRRCSLYRRLFRNELEERTMRRRNHAFERMFRRMHQESMEEWAEYYGEAMRRGDYQAALKAKQMYEYYFKRYMHIW